MGSYPAYMLKGQYGEQVPGAHYTIPTHMTPSLSSDIHREDYEAEYHIYYD